MPKRSNEFQKIILILEKKLAANSQVIESALLEDRQTHYDVEVDVLIKGAIAETPISIGVECRDRSRPSTVEWVREMIGKHEHLPLDKTILISKSGYTKQAITKAEENGVEALTFEEAETHDWQSELGDLKNLKMFSFGFTLLSGSVVLKEDIAKKYIDQIGGDTPIFDDQNANGITLKQYGESYLRNSDIAAEVMRLWLLKPKGERENEITFNLKLEPKTKAEILIEGDRFEVMNTEFVSKASFASTAVDLKAARYKNSEVAYSTVENIFPQSSNPGRNAVFAIVKTGLESGSMISIPDFEGKGDREFSLKTYKANNQKT